MPHIEWYATCFPSRYAAQPVVVISLTLKPKDLSGFPRRVEEIRDLLVVGGILDRDEEFPPQPLPAGRAAWYGSLLAQTALLFQRKTGHRVDFFEVDCEPDTPRCRVLVEHEHCDVGMTAVKLAGELLSGKRRLLREPFRVLREFAADRALPRDTEAIIRAARRLDIPCTQLERQPYRREEFAELTAGRCLRRNGLLLLGYGIEQHLLDGTFCLDRCGEFTGLLDDARARRAFLEELGLPVSRPDVRQTAEGERFRLVAVNGRVTAAQRARDGTPLPLEGIDPSLRNFALAVSRALHLAPIAVTVEAAAAQLGEDCAPRIGDFDIAPDLDMLAKRDHAAMQTTAAELVAWLFPDPGKARMPTFAVTGTNGKTTTSRMIAHLLKCAGHRPGLVCTDGIYLDGRRVESGDYCADTGHLRVLASRDVDAAVLECHHIGIIYRGFAFDWCDVGICLNVTEDHVGVADVDSVARMAQVKQAVAERARHAAILNADDTHCLAMAEAVRAEHVGLVSLEAPADALLGRADGRVDCCCVLETEANEPWLVIYRGSERSPLMAVSDIPASFGGRARFVLSNAMHAVLAAQLAGVGLDTLRAGMASFGMSYENTPGRLNFHDGHPFAVIMDFAHNPDGFEKLGAFVEQLEVSGRRMLMFQVRGDETADYIRRTAAAAGGHFDHYLCRPHPFKKGIPDPEVLGLIREGLASAGVREEQISVVTDPAEAVETLLRMGRPGDLLVFAPGAGDRDEAWERIVSFSPRISPG